MTNTRQLIQESMREMEAHKAKRLAARSEMINLAKVISEILLLVCEGILMAYITLLNRVWREPKPMVKK